MSDTNLPHLWTCFKGRLVLGLYSTGLLIERIVLLSFYKRLLFTKYHLPNIIYQVSFTKYQIFMCHFKIYKFCSL